MARAPAAAPASAAPAAALAPASPWRKLHAAGSLRDMTKLVRGASPPPASAAPAAALAAASPWRKLHAAGSLGDITKLVRGASPPPTAALAPASPWRKLHAAGSLGDITKLVRGSASSSREDAREQAAQLYATLLARGTRLYEAEYRRTRLGGGGTPSGGSKPGGSKPGGSKPAGGKPGGGDDDDSIAAFTVGAAGAVAGSSDGGTHNYEPAIAAFREAVALDATHPAAHFALAVAYKAFKRPALAARAACDAVERCADYSGTWADAVEIAFACYRELTVAEAAATLGRRAWWWTDEALLQFSKHAVKCNADEPRAWVMRAEVLCACFGAASWPGQRQPRAARDYREAAEAFATAAKLTRPSDGAWQQRLLSARQRCLRLELAPPPLTPVQRQSPPPPPPQQQQQQQQQQQAAATAQRKPRKLGEAAVATGSANSSGSSSSSRSLPRVGIDLSPMTVVEVKDDEDGYGDDEDGSASGCGSPPAGSRTTSAAELFAIRESSSYK